MDCVRLREDAAALTFLVLLSCDGSFSATTIDFPGPFVFASDLLGFVLGLALDFISILASGAPSTTLSAPKSYESSDLLGVVGLGVGPDALLGFPTR